MHSHKARQAFTASQGAAMHLPTRAPRRIVAATARACTAILLPAAALAAPSLSAASAAATAPAVLPTCATSALAVWLGVGPGGAAAGRPFYPLEFTDRESTPL